MLADIRKIHNQINLIISSILVLLILVIFSCEKLELIKKIKVTTGSITDTTRTSCVAHSKIIDTGEDGIIEYGHCWSKTDKPSISDFKTELGSASLHGEFTDTLSGLSANTKYYVKAYAIDSEGKPTYGDQTSFITLPPVKPSLTTSTISNITSDSVTCGGNITFDGDAPITARGVCWSTTQNPTLADNHTSNGSSIGEFVSVLTGLSSNTTYYVCAYATNSAGTAYGDDRTFKTSPGVPTITTTEVTSITDSSAISGGNITNDGGASVTARGICWSTIHNPSLLDSHNTDDVPGTGSFISNLIDLTPVTTYYIRAYATNSFGTVYGNEITFKTSALVPSLTTTPVLSISATSAVSGGIINSDGGAPVTAKGVCWSPNQIPIVTDSHTDEGTGTGNFASNLTGLNSNTKYYVRAYATNSAGTGYGDTISFKTKAGLPTLVTTEVTSITETTAFSGGTITNDGGAPVTARGVCWSTSMNPSLSDYSTADGSGTGAFVSNLTGLKNKTTYYVRAYATNSSGTQYGNELSFTTVSLPTLITFPVTNVTSNSAMSGGNVTNDGGTPVIAKGVCWNTSGNPKDPDGYTINGSGIGSFNSFIPYLEPNTTYYLWAYATNGSGTGYGAQQSFTTSATITDIDGNIYNTVQIGTQLWMLENLKVIHYQDGSPIPLVADNSTWISLSTGAYCNYNNEEINVNTYGRLYNFYSAVDNRKLCPAGWHVPSGDEWLTLINYLGGTGIAGGKMKETGTLHWNSPNSGATNESGFTCLPGGFRNPDPGEYHDLGISANLWSSTEHLVEWVGWRVIRIGIFKDNSEVNYGNEIKSFGYSVRCLQGEGPLSFPTLTTTEATSIKAYTAISGGNITNDGYATVEARGVCWNTSGNPALSDNYTTDGSGMGIFTSNITGLSPLTTYYVRAYATNSMGTAYGNEISFTTGSDDPPTAPTNISATPGDGEINIKWDGVSNASTYIIYWSNSPNVSKINFTGKITDIITTTYLHTGLTKGITYYYVVTAKNDYGESDESLLAGIMPPLLFQTNNMTASGEKHTYQVIATEGQNLFILMNIPDERNIYYLYVKYGSLPTITDYDTISNTGEDEVINIINTQSGTYYIMVYAYSHYCDGWGCSAGEYTLTASTNVIPLTFGIHTLGTINHTQEKDYYEVTVSAGQSLFVTTHNTDNRNDFYIYAKHGSLPTVTDYDAKSETGEDESLSIINTQSGTYYIMVYAFSRYCDGWGCASGDYTVKAFTSK